MLSDFYKKNKTDTIWWIDNLETFGEHFFSFDKKHIYNLFQDYSHNMTDAEVEIFNSENPYWADFFSIRQKS